MYSLEEIKKTISTAHSNDEEHCEAIFSTAKKVIVEAPAGSGKTKILISKLAYNMASNGLPNNKKILALTFSVNAAYKIKKDIANDLPILNEKFNKNPTLINKKITVTNFHGIARKILKKYGYLLDSSLKNIEEMEGVSDGRIDDIAPLSLGFKNIDEMQEIVDFHEKIKTDSVDFVLQHAEFEKYIKTVKTKFLPKKKIPFNAYLIFLLELFYKYPELKKFYNCLYEIIIVDEFQDTNSLSWEIIKNLVSVETKLWILGDPLQRIYGFIGAVDDLMQRAKDYFSMDSIVLHKNYRFKNNQQLLLIDKNIRACAENVKLPKIEKDAGVPLYAFENVEQECLGILKIINKLSQGNNDKIAILTRQKSKEIDYLVELFEKENVDYFYGLFSDEDKEYVDFHKRVLKIFLNIIEEKKPRTISKTFLDSFYNQVEKTYKNSDKLVSALKALLKVFLENLLKEYVLLEKEEKVSFIIDVLSNRSLKQSMEHVKAKIILSTIHGAKGLEWEHVLLIGAKNFSLPSFELCRNCKKIQKKINCCELNLNSPNFDKQLQKKYIEELSVFYVAVTRAKKTLTVTTNEERINAKGERYLAQLSCFLKLPGLLAEFID